MNYDTDVLIVGAGPTGLMMACQLQRFNIPFQIIEKQSDRAHESRAFAIQARTMEIFQNLGIADEFVKRAQAGARAQIYMHGKPRMRLEIGKLDIQGAPYPTIYFLPQSDTEEIFINHLQKQNVNIQRNMVLSSFTEKNTDDGKKYISASVQNLLTNETKTINARYIIGCDGAHSKVRQVLNITFEGASYQQEFMLADCFVDWNFPKNDGTFRVFFGKEGVFGVIPLSPTLDRVIGARVIDEKKTTPPDAAEINELANSVAYQKVEAKDIIWASRFYLHHRAVNNYQVGNAFIAGDAAHIHTPVGGQGMNTGLQDVTNLAWKIAFVIKYGSPEKLLETYQTERHFIGHKLVETTDKAFGLMTSQNFFIRLFRLTVLPYIMAFVNTRENIKKKIFLFISELQIHYYKSEFADEDVKGADQKFRKELGIAYRAPDAPLEGSTLFEKFRETPCQLLVFTSHGLTAEQLQSLNEIERTNENIIKTFVIKHSMETQVIFDRYGVNEAAIYFIRPDGYIGFRAYGLKLAELQAYLEKLF